MKDLSVYNLMSRKASMSTPRTKLFEKEDGYVTRKEKGSIVEYHTNRDLCHHCHHEMFGFSLYINFPLIRYNLGRNHLLLRSKPLKRGLPILDHAG